MKSKVSVKNLVDFIIKESISYKNATYSSMGLNITDSDKVEVKEFLMEDLQKIEDREDMKKNRRNKPTRK